MDKQNDVKAMSDTLVFVVYDSVTNSVFDGQVLQPLLNFKKTGRYQRIVLITYEPTALPCEISDRLTTILDTFIVLKRLPFLGTISLKFAAHSLKKVLSPYTDFDLIARGPLAGWLVVPFITRAQVTIQARGLLSEEYTFAHKHSNSFMQFIHRFRAGQLLNIERQIYGLSPTTPITIEAVSPAMADYLVDSFATPYNLITIAQHDIPAPIAEDQKRLWRKDIRSRLGLAEDAVVYCYNGSVKSWQCPDLTISFFKVQLSRNARSFLLILTQDIQPFKQLLEQALIPEKSYLLLTVKHHEIAAYLCAADAGIIFREEHILNWVSRPTKALEYTSAGLTIVHNNTVAWLENHQSA